MLCVFLQICRPNFLRYLVDFLNYLELVEFQEVLCIDVLPKLLKVFFGPPFLNTQRRMSLANPIEKPIFLNLLCLYLPSDEFFAFGILKDFFELCSLNELMMIIIDILIKLGKGTN